MINLNLNQDSKLTFRVGVVGTKVLPSHVRLCLGNENLKMVFDASPINDVEWSCVIPALPELIKYFKNAVRIKIEVVVSGRFFVPFDKELLVDSPSCVSFDVGQFALASTKPTPQDVITVAPAEENEEEEKVVDAEPKETEETKKDDEEIIIIKPTTEEKKPVTKSILLGEQASANKKKPTLQSLKKYKLKPLTDKKPLTTPSVGISNIAKSVIKEEAQKPVKRNIPEVAIETKKANINKPFKLIKKNIVEK